MVDSINAASQGVFRGSGRQVLGAKLNFLAFYIVGLPLSAVLDFCFNGGLISLWLGITAGLLTSCVFSVTYVYNTDWHWFSRLALSRLQSE